MAAAQILHFSTKSKRFRRRNRHRVTFKPSPPGKPRHTQSGGTKSKSTVGAFKPSPSGKPDSTQSGGTKSA